MKVGDLIMHMYKLKPWKRLPTLVVGLGRDMDQRRVITGLNPERGLINFYFDKCVPYEESKE